MSSKRGKLSNETETSITTDKTNIKVVKTLEQTKIYDHFPLYKTPHCKNKLEPLLINMILIMLYICNIIFTMLYM